MYFKQRKNKEIKGFIVIQKTIDKEWWVMNPNICRKRSTIENNKGVVGLVADVNYDTSIQKKQTSKIKRRKWKRKKKKRRREEKKQERKENEEMKKKNSLKKPIEDRSDHK